jgi:hypothetical protein
LHDGIFSLHLTATISSLCTEICSASSESDTITWSSAKEKCLNIFYFLKAKLYEKNCNKIFAWDLTKYKYIKGCEKHVSKNSGKYSVMYRGLFISPSGISDPCGTVDGMVTPKGSMSTEGEALQISVLPYRCSICAPLVTRQMSIL